MQAHKEILFQKSDKNGHIWCLDGSKHDGHDIQQSNAIRSTKPQPNSHHIPWWQSITCSMVIQHFSSAHLSSFFLFSSAWLSNHLLKTFLGCINGKMLEKISIQSRMKGQYIRKPNIDIPFCGVYQFLPMPVTSSL